MRLIRSTIGRSSICVIVLISKIDISKVAGAPGWMGQLKWSRLKIEVEKSRSEKREDGSLFRSAHVWRSPKGRLSSHSR